MKKNKQFYYKITLEIPEVETIINTSDTINNLMVSRFFELKKLMKMIYDCSENNHKSIKEILLEISKKKIWYQKIFNSKNKFETEIKLIKSEIKVTNFIIHDELKYFTYYVLEKVKSEIKTERELPDRFRSSYFFQSINDCEKYLKKIYDDFNIFPQTSIKHSVIEVKFMNINSLHKFDNNYISQFQNYYHAKNYYSDIKSFLMSHSTENPIFEFVFNGTYKIIRNDIKI